MLETILKTDFPNDLSNQYLIGLVADLRGSTQTKKYPRSDTTKYPKLKKEFKKIAEAVLHKEGKCIWQYRDDKGDIQEYFKAGEGGDNVEVAFINPWPDIAVVCALHFALSLHDEVLKHGFDSHGIAVGIQLGKVELDKDIEEAEPNAFTDATRIKSFVRTRYPDNYETRIIVSGNVFDVLPFGLQQVFNSLGLQDIEKEGANEQSKVKLFELQKEKIELLTTNLRSFFKTGLVGILPKGLCPDMGKENRGDQNFLKYLIDSTHGNLKILQTYLPHIEDFQSSIKNALNRAVGIRILLLNPYLSSEFAKIVGMTETLQKLPPLCPQPCSLLAFQRGVDLGYEPPLKFHQEIDRCRTILLNMRQQVNKEDDINKCYDATPSACLHIFDDLLFLGNFLQKSFALSTPHFVIIRGSYLCKRYEEEFESLWNSIH